MEVASLFVGPVVNCFRGWIMPKLRNLTSSAERVRDMGKKMEDLEGQGADIERHVEDNKANNRETPKAAEVWLKKYKKIKEDVDKISSDDIGCFNLRKKYRAGKNALTHIEDIKSLIEESKGINCRGNQIPLGRVDSKRPASTSTSTSGGNTQIGYESRDKIFHDALKFLQDDDKTRVIALCGMGGVGKTTLMKQLKEAAEDKKMFNYIAEVVIGNTPNLLDIQKAIAEHIREPLTGTDVKLMAKELSKTFKVRSDRKEKILVILDDVWEKIKLEDIGLKTPLPNGVKLLLTSRNVQVCRRIAVDVDAASVLDVVEVDVLKEDEARDLFCRIAGISADDRNLYKIACKIVKKCGYLPLAIKLIAATLQGEQTISVWRCTIDRLKINDLDEKVQEIIKISYESLKQEDKAIFLLCGLFPEDSNISIEDLTRYARGLNLLKQVSAMGKARDRTQTSVSNLKNAYLLMDGDSRHTECVKMHDLVLAFVVATVSKGGEEGCWIIHHDDFSKWSEANNMSQSESCQQISLACKGMSEFPSELKFPNLSLLKLMHGNESLRFPPGFYEGMKKLQVIAFEKLEYPVVPTSFQCSTNLRTLCLDECSLMLDLTRIGNLSNLEVLSFANSGITILPSTFGNLKKLRLLDVTGCYNLVIDDGVLKNMAKLEELYMIAFDKKACCFTDNNCNELAERSEHLSALEFEFIGNNAHLKNMAFEKLNRFKLSVGCYYSEVRHEMKTSKVDTHSYLNSLKLVTNREELLKSKINELFKMTYALYLQVNDMNTLEDAHPQHHPRNSSFYNLRFLVVSKCADLRYLFTMNVATSLSKLEYLEISKCRIMETVIHAKNAKNDESDIIKFSNLKYLRLAELPNLSSFCDKVNVIELPCLLELQLEGLQSLTSIYPSSASSSVSSNISRMQSFFHEEDATPKLEKLFVSDMENLKEIWPPQFSSSNLCLLRELMVEGCDSVEVLFTINFGEIEQLSSSLRSIKVKRCDSLVKLFSCNPFPFLNNLQELEVESCGSIKVLFDDDWGSTGGEQVFTSSLRSIVVEYCDSLVNLLPSNSMPLFNHLEMLMVLQCASVEVIFDIDMGCVGKTDKVSSSSGLRSIQLMGLGKLREVWRIKDAGNNLILHGFEAVESIHIALCGRFENIITPATTNFEMRALKQVQIYRCGRERERNNEMVESKQDQEVCTTL
ncbi:NB-ARC domains-containing protein [Tanacetum coccineum]